MRSAAWAACDSFLLVAEAVCGSSVFLAFPLAALALGAGGAARLTPVAVSFLPQRDKDQVNCQREMTSPESPACLYIYIVSYILYNIII